MLFQPTNITPNVLSGAENGYVDASDGMTISWQVNGNSPLVAYRVGIYSNDVESTQLYNSGILYPASPIYPVDYKGEQQRCSVTISASALSSAGITNGNEYKIGIRQFWDADNLDSDHSIRTASDSVFITRADANVSITSPASGTTIASYAQTFTARYYQGNSYSASASYDPIEWVRWRIYDSADRGRTIYDSQKIYTQQLQLDYDGFLNGRSYVVVLDIMNSAGQSATTTATYDISWAAQTTKDFATAARLNNQSSAVKVSWGSVEYTTGVGVGNYKIKNSKLILRENSNVVWNTTNGSAMSLAAEWGLIMNTTIRPVIDSGEVGIVSLTMSNNDEISISYNRSTRLLSISGYGSGSASTYQMSGTNARLKIFISKSSINVWKYVKAEGITPSTSLTPSATLVPTSESSPHMQLVASKTYTSATQTAISEIMVEDRQDVDFIEVVSNITADQITEITAWGASPDDDALTTIKAYSNTSFLADFDGNLDAGNYSIGGVAITGWDVYRKRKSEAFARHLCTMGIAQMSFLDYGCGSQQGKYTYFVYPRSAGGTFITSAIQSNTIKPVFWNWSIIEAEYDDDTNRYNVLNEYVFRNNVSSGSVSNNNSPSISTNFTQYPTVQMSGANYQSGTLTGLIGQVGFTSYVVQYGNSLVDLEERFGTSEEDILADNELSTWENHGYTGKVIKLFNPDGKTEYFDDKAQRDAIWALSTTTNHLFLKSRKGDVIEIRISGSITMNTNDNTPQQAITANIPWVQVANAEDETLICVV